MQRNPTAWVHDVVGHKAMQRALEAALLDDERVVLVSAAEAAVLLEQSEDTLHKTLGVRAEAYKRASIIIIIMSDRKKGMGECTASHFHGGIMDMRDGTRVRAFHADSGKTNAATGMIARAIFSSVMRLVQRPETQLEECQYQVPQQNDSWSCMWRMCLALNLGVISLFEYGEVPSFEQTTALITDQDVYVYRDTSVTDILQVGLLRSMQEGSV